jgi:hypothetical protein
MFSRTAVAFFRSLYHDGLALSVSEALSIGVCVMPLGEISNWSRRTGVDIWRSIGHAFYNLGYGQVKS